MKLIIDDIDGNVVLLVLCIIDIIDMCVCVLLLLY